jgi:hypothetical protein
MRITLESVIAALERDGDWYVTERGHAFLAEHKKRTRDAEIARLEAEVARLKEQLQPPSAVIITATFGPVRKIA